MKQEPDSQLCLTGRTDTLIPKYKNIWITEAAYTLLLIAKTHIQWTHLLPISPLENP